MKHPSQTNSQKSDLWAAIRRAFGDRDFGPRTVLPFAHAVGSAARLTPVGRGLPSHSVVLAGMFMGEPCNVRAFTHAETLVMVGFTVYGSSRRASFCTR